jgi:uncharacterized protein YqcC (DUF446 family)
MGYEELSKKLDEIEAEMRRVGIKVADSPEPIKVTSAFGGAEMAFENWLALVFLPSARKAVAGMNLPKQSQVGVAAMRNFDGYDEMNRLVSMLSQFDQAVESVARQGGM